MKKLFVILSLFISVTCFGSQSWAKQDCLKTMEHISYGVFTNCYGSYVFDNNDRYVGEWKNDKPHGQGTFTYSNGKIEEGTWKDGILVNAQKIQKTEKKHKEISKNVTTEKTYLGDMPPCPSNGDYNNCYGSFNFDNGDKYIGNWQNNEFSGQGTYTYSDGTVEEGVWKNNRFQYPQKIKKNNNKSNESTSKNMDRNWKKLVTTRSGNTFYLDFQTTKKIGENVYYWYLVDYLKPSSSGYLSSKVYIEGDCKLLRLKGLSYSFHKEPMGEGKGDIETPKEPKWIYPSPKTINQGMVKLVCRDKKQLF